MSKTCFLWKIKKALLFEIEYLYIDVTSFRLYRNFFLFLLFSLCFAEF